MAIINATLAAGSVASPYFYQVNITESLCKSSCSGATPDFSPTFVLMGYASVGEGQYMATIAVHGTICYVPCGCSACCTKSQLVSQTFSLSFYSETAPTSVTVTQGASVNDVATKGCDRCGNVFVSETPLVLTVETA